MTEFSLEVMSHIDPALVEEVELLKPRRLTPRFRAAVLAACLCLALVGTGMAAVANGWIRLSELTSRQINRRDGTMLSIATVEVISDSGRSYVPWERFSPRCRDFLRPFLGMPQYKGFDTWEELEAFLGLNIMDNPVLDQAKPAVHENTSSLGGRTETGSCFAGFHGTVEEPERIFLSAVYQFETHDGVPLYLALSSTIQITPRESEDQIAGRSIYQSNGEEAIELTSEDHVTPSGQETVIITSNMGDIETYIQVNGTVFRLDVHCGSEYTEEGLRTVKEVLDAFT